MDTKWIKIRAWHAVSKAYEGSVIDELPAGKSCESCLRIVARLNDQ